MSVQIAVRLADAEIDYLDAAVARGTFPSRAAGVRAGLQRLLQADREAEIERAYRRAHARHPEEPGIGEAGLAHGARLLADEQPNVPAPGEV